ncbi:threonine-tRNA ligase [Sporothrix schenckii ATCC 58251]|uniref:threonine--tRNA ligase n=1 Tax=Sporothrix schenckii (strain ATCC 58251 / de Perez 2211183) TaxID=1391915 RepID=U7PMM0_SPOS1|nr:threonine-tRNA ligase [Sporothrix schenckii ATCC 58251]
MLSPRHASAALRAPAVRLAVLTPPFPSSSSISSSSARFASVTCSIRGHRHRHPPRPLVLLSRQYCSSHGSPQTPQAEKDRVPPDHRDLGVQQELFTTSVYSPGSPIFLPNGARIFNRLVDFLRKQYVRYGFQEVITPTIYKKALWAKSGHLDNYADDMFTVTSASLKTGEKRVDAGAASPENESVEDEYGLKPMNCPGHCLIFAAQRHSYRDLPIRYADFSPLHRDEISGALSGLTRVRRFHQDDGHVFCRPSQVEDEIRATLDFVRFTYDVLGLGPYRLVLSTRPTDGHLIGSEADWDAAEAALRRALDHSGQAWTLNPGDGAFYGPKIDIVLQDSDGKEHQTATVQLDFQLPRRFALSYQAPSPELERAGRAGDVAVAEAEGAEGAEGAEEAGPVTPVLIHRAVLGSVERLMALLIEHYNGRWPFWLNPRQAIVLTVNDSDAVVGFAKEVQAVLAGTSVAASDPPAIVSSPTLLAAVDVDTSARTLPLKVREAKSKGYGAIVVVGPKDVAKGTVSVDLSGIPVKNGNAEEGAAPSKEKKRSIEMTPEALLRLLQEKVAAYQ